MVHPGLIGLLGYYVRSEETVNTKLSEHRMIAVKEYGIELKVVHLFHKSIIKRLKLALP